MSLKLIIKEDLDNFRKQQENDSLKVIQMLLSSINKKEIDSRKELTDSEIVAVIRKTIKSCKESIELFKKGNRKDLVDKEEYEVNLLTKYLPAELSLNELNNIIDNAVIYTDSKSIKDFGKVLKFLKDKLEGNVDMSKVSEIVKTRLSK